MKITAILSAVAVAFSLSATTAFSAEKKPAAKPAETPKKEAPKKEAPKTEVKKDHYPLYGEVVSITETTLTIKGGEGKENRKFDINKDTVIKKDDKPATIKDAKEGQWVGGYVKKDSDGKGNDEIVSLNLSAKQKEAKPETKPEPKKTEKKPATTTPPKKKTA